MFHSTEYIILTPINFKLKKKKTNQNIQQVASKPAEKKKVYIIKIIKIKHKKKTKILKMFSLNLNTNKVYID